MADHRYDFSGLIEERTRKFTGRTELFNALEIFSNTRACGYFVITGASGLGKTSIAAEIARRYQATVFCSSVQENRPTSAQCLNHICADLIVRFKLPYTHLPPRGETDSGFLGELLDSIALAHAPLWLVVDALDETDVVPGRNPLLLPHVFPPESLLPSHIVQAPSSSI